MQFRGLILVLGVAAWVLTGCETPYGTPDQTGTGALVGGGVGAVSGALIGGASGRAGEGALIGGAVGAIAGGLIGHSMDMQEQERLRAEAPQTYVRVVQGQPLSVADVKALAQAKLSDDVIISQIRNSRTVYHLSAADIIDLHNAGVSQQVINYMINTPTTMAGSPPVPVTPQPNATGTRRTAAAGAGGSRARGARAWVCVDWRRMGVEWRVALGRRTLGLAAVSAFNLDSGLLGTRSARVLPGPRTLAVTLFSLPQERKNWARIGL